MEFRPLGADALAILLVLAFLLTPHPAHTAAAQTPGIIVPLYSNPGSQSDAVVAAKMANPSVPIIAVVNPSNGPGWARDPTFAQGINNLKNAGIVVVGYVFTGYGTQPISTVETSIMNYLKWYGVNGIFFDELPHTAGYEAYYRTLDSFTKSNGMQITIGNPGTSLSSSYAGVLDMYVVSESSAIVSSSSLTSMGRELSPSSLAVVMYSVQTLDQSYVSGLVGAGAYLYVTDWGAPNPYSVLSGYFANLVNMVAKASDQEGSGTAMVTVDTFDANGNPLPGFWTTVVSSGGTTLTGFSPFTFTAASGGSYQATVSNYRIEKLDHWSNGATTNTITITPGENVVISAYYTTGPKVQLNIETARLDGSGLTGMWTTISQGSSTLASGYTPVTFQVVPNNQYSVTVADFATAIFDHWSSGGVTNTISVTPSTDMSLTAYYAIQNSTTTLTRTVTATITTTVTGTETTVSTTTTTLARTSTIVLTQSVTVQRTVSISSSVAAGAALTTGAQSGSDPGPRSQPVTPALFVGVIAASVLASAAATRYYQRRKNDVSGRK